MRPAEVMVYLGDEGGVDLLEDVVHLYQLGSHQ